MKKRSRSRSEGYLNTPDTTQEADRQTPPKSLFFSKNKDHAWVANRTNEIRAEHDIEDMIDELDQQPPQTIKSEEEAFQRKIARIRKGGRARKTRKTRKTRKSRKTRKTRKNRKTKSHRR